MSNLTVPTSFQEKLRDSIFEKFLELFPKEILEEAIATEIKDFFEADTSEFVVGKAIVPNPDYKPKEWQSRSTIEVSTVRYLSKVTPFRQLVWSAINDHVGSMIKETLANNEAELTAAINNFYSTSLSPELNKGVAANIDMIAKGMAASAQVATLQAATREAHAHMVRCLQITNVIDYSQANSLPQPVPPVVSFVTS